MSKRRHTPNGECTSRYNVRLLPSNIALADSIASGLGISRSALIDYLLSELPERLLRCPDCGKAIGIELEIMRAEAAETGYVCDHCHQLIPYEDEEI